jgi:hypothetical protein
VAALKKKNPLLTVGMPQRGHKRKLKLFDDTISSVISVMNSRHSQGESVYI